ncbi:hypothetical protein BH23ACI1_BH23ACI1_28110 [soil metagenome]
MRKRRQRIEAKPREEWRPQREPDGFGLPCGGGSSWRRNLRATVEDGAGAATVLGGIRAREADIARLRAELAGPSEPFERKLAVIPAWVRQ